MAYSGVRFATSLMEAMTGRAGVVECAFVQSDVSECEFFATPITLGVSDFIYPLSITSMIWSSFLGGVCHATCEFYDNLSY